MPEEFKGEKIERDLVSKQVWHYYDTEAGINQISKELFKKTDKVIHYPRGFEGGEKYNFIKKFTYLGFGGKLPIGVVKAVSYGWGFTKTLNPFTYFIDETYEVKEVIIEKKGKTELDVTNKILYLNETSLQELQDSFSAIYKKNRSEVDFVLQLTLNSLFPKVIDKPEKTYIANALASSLSSWGNSIDEFSDGDKKAIQDLFDKLSIGTDFLSKESLAKTKEIVDSKFIQKTIERFNELFSLVTDGESLEKHWQVFLQENSWVFSSIFAQPIILYQREAYVGGKSLDNKNGKMNDFLIKNSLSDNVSFLEIKTHKTKLVENSSYRGEDVYSISKDLSGSTAQVLNQRDNFQKEFYALKAKSRKNGNFETFNSKCIVLIGNLADLDEDQRYSFELSRSNSKDVEIITFDELKAKIESFQELLNEE
ncbi:Shedu immune nuclease family protein [Aquaticitalea lipolytica]|uniref:Shedu immune nuclease family protein n=1 Tax=Aquaticitalea lipolytica TaxID=1247562 RepID=UPI0024BAE167|nr:DUF4263 domain-containing protein [Aquaticitalea lipolytica]